MKHPENLKDVNAVKVTEELKSFVNEMSSEIEQADADRADWRQRDDNYYRKRFGLRNKKVFPWPGAANFVMPLIDSDIARQKPAYVNLAYGVSPIVAFEPFGPEDVEPSRKREILLDWRIKHRMNFFEPYVCGIDKMLQKGFVVFKVVWKFESRKYTEFLDLSMTPEHVLEALYNPEVTDIMLKKVFQEELDVDLEFEENDEALDKMVEDFRSGKTVLEQDFFEHAHNEPELIVCDPNEDIVVPVDTTDIQSARFIDYKFWVTANDIKVAMRDEKYNSFPDNEIEGWSNKKPIMNKTQDKFVREGVNRFATNDDLILLHETCVMYDINGDGIDEKCIVTWPDSSPASVLRFIENPYDHGMWPYTQVEREFVDTGFYSSRGIPALDDDFQTGISTKFNQDVDNQTIVNTPTVVYRRNAVKNMSNLRYIPGQRVEVDDPAGYEIRQQVNASQGTFLTTQQVLKAWAQERLGNVSSGLTNPNNLPGTGQQGKKTAREVEAVAAVEGQATSLALLVFQNQMKDVYHQIEALYLQFGQDEETIMTNEGAVKVSRKDVQSKANMVPNGKLDNSNPVLRAQKSFLMFQAFRGDPRVNQDELYKMYLDDVDPRASRRLLISPQEQAQLNELRAQQAELLKAQTISESVDLKRIETALDLEKEAGIEEIHGRRYAPDGAEGNGRDNRRKTS